MTVIPSELDVQEAALRRALSDLHTCMPAEVVAVRAGADQRQFVDVLPMLQRAVVNEDGVPLDEPLPLLQMVPMGTLQAGGFHLSLPVRVGDVVLVVFAERSLDSWIETARPGARSPVVPGDLSMHTLQGAIALPLGPRPRGSLLQGVDASDLVIATASGTVLARFTQGGAVTFAEGTQYVALANLVGNELSRIQTDITTLKAATSAAIKAICLKLIPADELIGPAFDLATAAIPSNPGSVAATKTKAT